jgi:hypothetical protein
MRQHSSADCYTEVATDGVRKTTQSRASESSMSGEGMGESHATNDRTRTCGLDRSEAG